MRERYPSRRVRVVNAGVPGTNTRYVVESLLPPLEAALTAGDPF